MVVAHGRVGKADFKRGGRRIKSGGPPRQIWADHVRELALKNGIETDRHRLEQRQKQIDERKGPDRFFPEDFGRNTVGYDTYRATVPIEARTKEMDHPLTPQKEQKCSKRSWDAQVRRWRAALHRYDPDPVAEDIPKKNPTDPQETCNDHIEEVYDDIELDDDGNPVFKAQTSVDGQEDIEATDVAESTAEVSRERTIYDPFEGS